MGYFYDPSFVIWRETSSSRVCCVVEQVFFPFDCSTQCTIRCTYFRILLSRHGLIGLVKNVVGFSDTVKLFKKVYPDHQSYKLQDLAKSFAPDFESSNAHNAEHDVSMLKNLLTNKPNMEESLRGAVFSTEYVIANNEKTIK